jgi:hypothetical protein
VWFKRWEEKGKSRDNQVHGRAASQITPSFFGSFSSKGQSVMSEGSTLDHSARLEPAIPGFPVLISRLPHIRAGHESSGGRGREGGVCVGITSLLRSPSSDLSS